MVATKIVKWSLIHEIVHAGKEVVTFFKVTPETLSKLTKSVKFYKLKSQPQIDECHYEYPGNR